MPDYYLIEHDNYWEIPVQGKPVCRFMVDSELKLEFLEPKDEDTVIIIKGEFQLEINGKECTMDAEKPTTLCPVFALYRKIVESALAHKDGRLEVRFLEGGKLSVWPDRNGNYESWEIVGVRWLRVICMPSGGLTVIQAEPPESSGGSVH